MKRILHCVPGNMDMGGIEVLIMNIYRNIDRQKYQFDFIVHKKEANYFEDEILKLGGNIYRLPNKSRNYFQYKAEFLDTIKNYEIVHIHSIYAFSYFEVKWATEAKKKVILHSHNSSANFKRKLLHILLRKKQNNLLKNRIACSDLAAKWMFKKSPYTLLHNGFKVEEYGFNSSLRQEIREKYNISNDVVFAHISRLDWQKDPMFSVSLFKEFNKKIKNSKLLLIGSGEYMDSIKKYCVNNGLENNVIIMGNRSDVHELLNAADIYLLPSRYEGLGISLVEAQINGLFCIVNKNIPEEAIVTDRVYMKKKDLKIWLNSIYNILKNTEIINREVEAIQYDKYKIENITLKIECYYDSL